MVREMAMLSPFSYLKSLATVCLVHFWCIFLATKKTHKSILHILMSSIQRKERDSNPRTLAGQRFSRPPHSTALPSFLLSDSMLHINMLVHLDLQIYKDCLTWQKKVSHWLDIVGSLGKVPLF